MMKIFRKLHLWLSVPFGVIVVLICFSGAMLVFESDITRMIQKDVYYVESVKDKPLPMEQLMKNVSTTLPDSVAITGVTVFKDADRTYQVNLSKPKKAAVYVDQYSGKITGRSNRPAFFSTMFKLHRWLLDGSNPQGDGVKIGKLIVGISTIMFVIVLISGVVIWWPRARKNLKRSLSVTFANGWKGFWRGLHVAGGMYALILVLAMALTGLTWSFEWYRNAFYSVCGVENSSQDAASQGKGRGDGAAKGGKGDKSHGRAAAKGNDGQSEFLGWQQAYDNLKAMRPDSPQITVSSGKASVALGTFGNQRASDSYTFNPKNGTVKLQTSYSDSDKADKVKGWINSVHVGSFGGLVTRIMWMLAALLGASLPLTGYYIWISRLRAKRKATRKLTQKV